MFRSTLLLLALSLPATVHAAADAEAGRTLFARRCASCHQVGPSARNGFGPQLNGIVGRTAGTADYPYSTAMRSAGLVWSHDTLRAFIESPDKVVPGNKMRFWGISDQRQIANLLAYLDRFR